RVGAPRGRPILEEMLTGVSVDERRAAAFGLGLIGEQEARAVLQRAVADSDPRTGRLAIEALARLQTPLVAVVEAAESLEAEEFWRRLLPSLFHFPLEDTLAAVDPLLEEDVEKLAPDIVHAVGRSVVTLDPGAGLAEAARKVLRFFLAHPDPWARGWAARGLGSIGTAADLEALLPFLGDSEPGPVIQALRAASATIASGRAATAEAWRPKVLALLVDDRSGVRLTAIETAGWLLLDERLSSALTERFQKTGGRERQLALRALVSGQDPGAAALVAQAAVSPLPGDRAAAAWSLGEMGLESRLARLAADKEPLVRLQAFAALTREGMEGREEAARLALLDSDVAVRATALDWLATTPVAPFGELALAIRGGEAKRLVEVRLAGIAALLERALAEPLERGAIVALLEILERDVDYLVRRAAGDSLARLDRPRSTPEPVNTDRKLADYRGLVRLSIGEPRVRLETARGSLILRLECEQAMLTCSSFLQLANQRFYDGLSFHRVVPDFVVQGGDPRGDGWGGPGFSIRDEPNLLRYERGVIGMATSGPDTAGSQFFIALSRQPHLDGVYTAFGRVETGDEILDVIVQGDTIERLFEIRDTGAGRVN
ncbi:MAG: peptidylprolyl isomerase, partial [Acidobacteriota bacterium]|nr:peptidylprolyl isomerase [Acidobacteriota bacterium]